MPRSLEIALTVSFFTGMFAMVVLMQRLEVTIPVWVAKWSPAAIFIGLPVGWLIWRVFAPKRD